jgi:hypothetical protein
MGEVMVSNWRCPQCGAIAHGEHVCGKTYEELIGEHERYIEVIGIVQDLLKTIGDLKELIKALAAKSCEVINGDNIP